MKNEKSFSFWLLFVASFVNIINFIINLRSFSLYSIISFFISVSPIAFLILIIFNNNDKKQKIAQKYINKLCFIIVGLYAIQIIISFTHNFFSPQFVLDIALKICMIVSLIICGVIIKHKKDFSNLKFIYFPMICVISCILIFVQCILNSYEGIIQFARHCSDVLFVIAIWHLPDIFINKEKAKTITVKKVIVVIAIILIALFVKLAKNELGIQYYEKEKGYWDENGYYNPSDEEMDEVWKETYDWMDKNW